jgi:hypothetical protein
MADFKATTAREIDLRSVTEGVNVAMHDERGKLLGQSQNGGMQAGDFYFRTNVVARYVKASWFRRVILRHREKLVTTYPTTVVMSCPSCGLPLMTSLDNAILSKHPLTLAKPTRCPYDPGATAHSFSIKDGNIMPA